MLQDSGREIVGIETKFFILSLQFGRVSEKERLALDRNIRVSRRVGLHELGAITPVGGNTRVEFIIRDRLRSNVLWYEADFAGHHVIEGSFDEAAFSSERARKEIVNLALPYISEVIAYLTGRAGINPIIIPPEIPDVTPTQQKVSGPSAGT